MKRRAILMIELLIAMLIITVMAGAFSLSTDIWTVTAKREAEKLAAKLNNLMLKSDSIKQFFRLTISKDGKRMIVQWDNVPSTKRPRYSDEEYVDAYKGCSYSWNATNRILYYSYLTNRYSQGATITVTGRGPTYYVVIATIGSRVRVSNKAP